MSTRRKPSNKAPKRPKREEVSPAMHKELGRIRGELEMVAHVAQLVVLAYRLPATDFKEHKRYLTVLDRFVVGLLHDEVAHIREIRLRGVPPVEEVP
jgi:hypothetical protein